jgi:glycosyltransferase involved in cell wall biosynthesis
MVRELRRSGIEVDVLTSMPNYPRGETFPGYRNRITLREAIDGVSVRRVWIYPGSGRSPWVRLLNYLSFTLMALPFALFGRRYDVVFVEAQPLSLGVIGLVMKWFRRVPYVFNLPDLQVDVARQLGFIRGEIFLGLASWLETFFMTQSWKVSTVTRGFMEHLHGRGLSRKQITYLPNGADTEFLQPKAECHDLLERWELHGKKVFLYVGTHAYYHGLDTIIHAARSLQDQRDIAFLMVGDGPERQRIVSLAAEFGLSNVVFGRSSYEEMADLYSIGYASIATLRDVPVARSMRLSKIFPSLSCAVPVLYSGFGEAAEFLENNGCGIAVAPEDPEELARAIRSLASDDERRAAMGRAGRKVVEERYSWKTLVQAWVRELREGEEPG